VKRGSYINFRSSKKALSTIVATLIILLLVMVAVGIVWVVVRNVIQQGAEQVSLGKLTLDMKISQVQKVNDTNVNVKVKRNSGEGDFVAISFIVDDGTNSEVVTVNGTMQQLEEKTFHLILTRVNASNIKSISIAPILQLSSGKEVTGPVKDTYTTGTVSTYTPAITTTNCGNGLIDSGEQCDGTNITTTLCSDYNSALTGTLSCASNCQYDTSQCLSPTCGDGTIDAGEQCDNGTLNTNTCTAGYESTCSYCQTGSCQIVTIQGSYCGDGVLDSANGETCDTTVPSGLTCETQMGTGYIGSLSCSSSCTIDTSACTAPSTCTNESTSTTCSGKCGIQTNNCGYDVDCGTCTTPTNDFSYEIPVIATASDFANTVYIDPSASTDGSGTMASPRNTLALTFQPDTAYLLKAGTTYTGNINAVFNNVYIGSYGTGAKPTILGHFSVSSGSSYLTFNNLTLSMYGTPSYGHMVLISSSSHITFANSKIIGLDNGRGYPYRGFELGGTGEGYLTLYHDEVAYQQNDGMYGDGDGFLHSTFVSNYFHHQNMGGVTSTTSTGDGIQMEGGNVTDTYFANNYIDRHDTIWKYGLLVNPYAGSNDRDRTIGIHNTFIGPQDGNGGAALRWEGINTTFRKNLIIVYGTQVYTMESWSTYSNQPEPYGMRDNFFVGSAGTTNFQPDPTTNKIFTTVAAYEQYVAGNATAAAYGSDIDPNNFWG